MDENQQNVTEESLNASSIDLKTFGHEKQISQLEHDIFLISKQLEETRDLLKDVKHQNATLKGQVDALEGEKIEKSKLIETLEKSRNESITERTKLQDIRIHLQSQKDTLEIDSAKLLAEKRRLIDELNAIKAECSKERKDKCLLQVRIDEFESEKNLIAYEKERWTQEKEILVQGKQWCMREISNRESRLNEMRIEMMKLEGNITRERFSMTEERDALSLKVDELSDSLAKKEQELIELRERLKQVVEERSETLNEMDSELRAKERLADLYKSSLDAANNEVVELKEKDALLENTLQDNEINIVNLNAEIEKLHADFEKEIEERDENIKRLSDELSKANELLRLGSRGDDEIAALSPSAAAASNLLRSGISLTSIYAEHCQVVTELEKKKAENERIERYVTDLIRELEERAPTFKEQKEAYDNALEEIKRITLQNELLSEDWNKVQNERDAIARELSFTKTELERYQHEHHALSMQIRKLLFSIERNSGSSHIGMNTDAEERLFSNISELQQTNLELIRKVKQLEEANAEAIRNAHNTESDALRAALQTAEKELERIREVHSRSEMVIMELTAQRDNYKKLYEEGGEFRTVSPPGTDKKMLSLDVHHLKSKLEFLQEKLDYFATDKQETDRAFNERIDQQMEQISQLRTTNGKLESALEYQKQNQQLSTKNIDELNKELKRANDSTTKLTVRIETLQTRNDDLTNQLLTQQQEVSQLRVMNHTLEEQLQVSRGNEHRANEELNILRNTSFNTERVTITLQEVETILKRFDTERQSSFVSQLQSACIERDNLKTLLNNINRQHNETTTKLKASVNELKSERDNAIFELKNLQENIVNIESRFNILKEEYDKLSSESLTSKVADDDIDGYKKEIQQLKNKCFYQEKQVKELQDKTEELTKSVDLKENELLRVCSLSGNMENLIQEQNDYAEAERKRLQAICHQHEENLNERRKQIEDLRNTVANLELQLLEKGRGLEHAESHFHEAETKYEQKCGELEALESSKQEACDQLQEIVNNLRAEYDEQMIKYNNLMGDKKTVDELIAVEKINNTRLTQLVDNLNVEIAKFKASADIAGKERLELIDKFEEYKKRDVSNLEKIEVLYDRIKEMMEKIDCMEKVQMASHEEAPNFMFDDSKQTERLNVILGYLREEKQKEMQNRMNAELQLMRLQSQASIDQQRIGCLEAELSQAKLHMESAAQVAREKEELLVKISAFREAQERYSLLKTEADNLKVQYETLSKKNAMLDSAHKTLQREKANVDRTNTTLSVNLDQRKKEIADLRERIDKAILLASKYSPENYTALQGEFEATKQQVANKEVEITVLKEQLQKSLNDYQTMSSEFEEKSSAYEKNQKLLNQMRTIARQYRESANKLEDAKQKAEAELEKLKSDYAASIAGKTEALSSWTTRSDAKAETLLREKIAELQELKVKLEEVERAKTELAEKVSKLEMDLSEKIMRLDMITTSLNAQREKTEKLNKTIIEKNELIEQLQQQIQVMSTISISSSSVDELLAAQPSEQQPSQQISTSRKRTHGDNGNDESPVVQEFTDKRSRIVDSDSLSGNVSDSATIQMHAQALLDNGNVSTSNDNVEMEKEAQEMLDEQVEYEDGYEDEDGDGEYLGEDEEYVDEEIPDDDDGDNGPLDENAEEFELEKNDSEIICLSGDEEDDESATQQSEAPDPEQSNFSEDNNDNAPQDPPRMIDANVEEEQD